MLGLQAGGKATGIDHFGFEGAVKAFVLAIGLRMGRTAMGQAHA